MSIMELAWTDDLRVPATSVGRPVVYRTRGRGHGDVFRLISPNGIGERLKPFVFLDSFSGVISEFTEAGGMHPHSGIGTLTVFTRGDVHFDNKASGYIGYGGAEWVRSGGGIWHGRELSSGKAERIHGFQLWLALSAELELSNPESQYVEARDMPQVGPAYVIAGTHDGETSPIKAPADVNYLLITLAPHESWIYKPPGGHTVGWLSLSRGGLDGSTSGSSGELLIFSDDNGPISLEAGPQGATFVLGSAVPHPHELHVRHYSVHTSAETLEMGERQIATLRRDLFGRSGQQRASGEQQIHEAVSDRN